MAVSQATLTVLFMALDKILLLAFSLAELIARAQAGEEVTDAEARPTPRAEIEARVDARLVARYRNRMIEDAKVIGGGPKPEGDGGADGPV